MVQIRKRSRDRATQRLDRLTQLIRASVPDWYSQAACGLADPAAFWADEAQTDPNKTKVNAGWDLPARRICATCPVRRECEQFVEEHNVRDYAVWAGKQRKNSNRAVTPYPENRYARADGHRSAAEDERQDRGTPLLPDPRVTADIDDLLARRDQLLDNLRRED